MNRFSKTIFGGLAIALAVIVILIIFGGIIWVLNFISMFIIKDQLIIYISSAIIFIISLIFSYFCNKPSKEETKANHAKIGKWHYSQR